MFFKKWKLVTHTAKLNAELTQPIHWKPIQLKFCIKIVFLSPNESTVVKCKKVVYYSTKIGGCAPHKKKCWWDGGGGLFSPPRSEFRRRDMICDIHPAVILVKQKTVSGRYHVIRPKLLPRPALFWEIQYGSSLFCSVNSRSSWFMSTDCTKLVCSLF